MLTLRVPRELDRGRPVLKSVSQVMIDKIVSVPRGAISGEIGQCDAGELETVDDGLRRWLELA